MIVYHGSNVIVSEPRLVAQNRNLDFGFGFYTMTIKTQAIAFADKVFRRRRKGDRIISIYEFDEQAAFAACSFRRFESPDEDWLDFVSENRAGTYKGKSYDLVYGPVANDDVYATFTLYTSGTLTKEQTIETLKTKKLYDQLVLSSEKALGFLHFIGTVPKEEF